MNPRTLLASPSSSVVFSIRELTIPWFEYEWQLSASLSLCDYTEFLVSIGSDFRMPDTDTRKKVLACRSRILEYEKELQSLKRTAITDAEGRAALAYLNRLNLESDTMRLKELSKALEKRYILGTSHETLRAAKVGKLRALIGEGTSQMTVEADQLMYANVFAKDSSLLDLSGKHIRRIFLERRRITTFTAIWKPWLAETRIRLECLSMIAKTGIDGRIIASYSISSQHETIRNEFERIRRNKNKSPVEFLFETMLDLSRELLRVERSVNERKS